MCGWQAVGMSSRCHLGHWHTPGESANSTLALAPNECQQHPPAPDRYFTSVTPVSVSVYSLHVLSVYGA
jgi:hypothetical protein